MICFQVWLIFFIKKNVHEFSLFDPLASFSLSVLQKMDLILLFLFPASAMVTYFTNGNVKLRGKTVYVQFSNRQELKTDSNASSRFKAALQAFSEQAVQNGEPYMGQTIKTAPSNFNTAGRGYGLNTVLHVIVENMVYPVTLDVIFQIFSRVGKVLKIITFNKANKFQVLEMTFS